jgi:hypothetical protein
LVEHHQLEEVRDALARTQVVVFIGARGTGKTQLAGELQGKYGGSGVECVLVDAKKASTLVEFNRDVARALECDPLDLKLPRNPNRRFRVIVDNCQEIYDAPWRDSFQDQWRAFLTHPDSAGRVSALFLGRPAFRDILGGPGSQLLAVADVRVARPFVMQELANAAAIEEVIAARVIRKTGGHPSLSFDFVRYLLDFPDDVAVAWRAFSEESNNLIAELVEDHGIGGRGVVLDLCRARTLIGETELVNRHFAGKLANGIQCIRDLVGCGIIARSDSGYVLAATMVMARAVQERIALPRPSIPVDEPGRHEHGAQRVYLIENGLRRAIVELLSGGDDAWWPGAIPDSISAQAQLLQQAERASRASPRTELHPIMYVELGELRDILVMQTVWDKARIRFGLERDAFEELWDDLKLVRNKVAHNRPLEDSDVAFLDAVATRLRLDPQERGA